MNMKYFPTCTSRLVVQHPCQVSFKSMQGCRSWEDKLKCVKILSVKDHNSAKICRTWIISPHALLYLWYNICTKFHSNPCKDVGGVEKTNFDGTEGRTKQTLNAPLPFYGGGIKMTSMIYPFRLKTGFEPEGTNANIDTWSCPFWDLHLFYLLRLATPISMIHYTSLWHYYQT